MTTTFTAKHIALQLWELAASECTVQEFTTQAETLIAQHAREAAAYEHAIAAKHLSATCDSARAKILRAETELAETRAAAVALSDRYSELSRAIDPEMSAMGEHSVLVHVATMLGKLPERCAALEEDKARLDWLDAHKPVSFECEGGDARAVIDAGMADSAQREKGGA
jgi:methylthioribose-1-phosphate isomerase